MNLNLTILISGGVMLSGGIKIIYHSNYEGSLDFYIGVFSTLVGLFFILRGILEETRFE